MGLFASLSSRKSSGRASHENSRRSRAAIERLEQRVLFAVQVNTNVFDGPPPSGTPAGWPTGVYADQAETTNATFSMPGSSSNQVAVVYNDGPMKQYQQLANGTPMHQTGWAYSSDGGQSFAQPSTDPANPALLPTVPNGTQTTGDDANHSLAWSNANATLYMASTSWPNHSDINVYESADGGRTFLAGVDATPGAPTAWGTTIATYDKPWLAVDNYPGTGDGTGYGALYLAYVENVSPQGPDYNQIVITGVAAGAPFASTSWPTPRNQDEPPGSILATGNVQSPEVLVEPNHSVDVVYMAADGIYIVHSDSPLSPNGWSNPPRELVAFQYTNGNVFWSDDLYANAGNGNTKETIVDIPHYPSAAIGQVGNDTYLYVTYMDGNLGGDQNDQPDGTFGTYFLQYDLSTLPQLPMKGSRVGQTTAVTDEWMPSLALSPDGRYAFIGFYGGNAVYNATANTGDEQYNTFYITGATNADGINWSAPTQITNLNGGHFDQPGGPSTDDFRTNPASQWRPDYDSASADYQNFHYSFMETSNEQVTDGSGNQSTIQDQSDIYMANVPIPGAIPATPSGLNVAPASIGSGNLTVMWNGSPYSSSNANAYVEYSAIGQGWLSFGQPVSASFGSVTYTIPNYSANTTYYFRVRAQAPPNSSADASSAWSAVVQSWIGATYTPDLWYYSAGTFTSGQVVHTLYNFDFAYPSDGEAVYADLQWWDSSNQRWDQIDHILLSSAGGLAYYFDPTAASGQSGVQITSSDQFQIHFDNSSGGSTAWLQLYPNLQTPANAPVEPRYLYAVMSDDGQTLELTWDATGYDSYTTMIISVTGNGSEWWNPDTQQIIWLVQNAAAQDGSASVNVSDDAGLTITFQTKDSQTGQISDVVTYYLAS